ncbi:MAG: hypothetical protein UV36_C0034G0002 [Parcubacteria group bacterium GW2011_GWC2_42_6]|nr:MAG: hypothetical protein UV36_C0034G0002 [Parcubacteria group bacterium GW2011_GWC2_42_6]KKT76673.1 MAG: hypothetical protein UW72_C0003G0022 [Parcubacteria group bacterium GW2011_GWF2_44_7]
MCLTIPKQVISIKGSTVKVKSGQTQQAVGSLIKVKKGDWVLTQNEVIINKINKEKAQEILKIIDAHKINAKPKL